MDLPSKPQERNSIFWKCKNIKKGMLSSVEVSVYFEKHKIIEIIKKILFEIARDRPGNVKKWLSDNIRRIANEFVCSRTFVLLPNQFDRKKLSDIYQKKFNIPTIVYKGKVCKCTKVLEKLELFLKKHNLTDKNKIFINFPENCSDLENFHEHSIKPSNIFEVRSDLRKKDPTCCLLEDLDLKNNYEAIQNNYKDIYQIIHYGSRETASNRLQSVEEIALKLAVLMQFSNIPTDKLLQNGFRYRIIIYGTRGSGQRTHALALCRRFNLVPLFASEIISSNLDKSTGIGTALRHRLLKNNELSLLSEAAAIHTRILQNDCIQHGWVLVEYPYNKESFKICIEKLIMPPNRIIILHCRKKLALRRLQKACNHKYPNSRTDMATNNFMKYVEIEMNYSLLQKNEIYNYINEADIQCIHIDGNHSYKTVEKDLWGRIEQDQRKLASVNKHAKFCVDNEMM